MSACSLCTIIFLVRESSALPADRLIDGVANALHAVSFSMRTDRTIKSRLACFASNVLRGLCQNRVVRVDPYAVAIVKTVFWLSAAVARKKKYIYIYIYMVDGGCGYRL